MTTTCIIQKNIYMWQGRHGIAYIYKQNVHSQSRRFMAMAMAMDGKQGKKTPPIRIGGPCVFVCVCLFLVCVEFEFEFESWSETNRKTNWMAGIYQEFDSIFFCLDIKSFLFIWNLMKINFTSHFIEKKYFQYFINRKNIVHCIHHWITLRVNNFTTLKRNNFNHE